MSGVGNISYTVFFSAITISLVGKKRKSQVRHKMMDGIGIKRE